MEPIKIGIIREDKTPVPDARVPLTPTQIKEINKKYSNVHITVQESPHRAFTNQEYRDHEIPVVSSMHKCDILMGVKEVPVKSLMEGKTYFFFSHTTKKQAYNRDLLRAVLDKNIRLVDYEALTDQYGSRSVGFGRYAGIVGSYNGLLAYGKRYNLYHLARAVDCASLSNLKRELDKIKLPPIKIILTGRGKVAQGAMELLKDINIQKVEVGEFLKKSYDEPVYVQLIEEDYYIQEYGGRFDRNMFMENPENYISTFTSYTSIGDLLIAGTYWNPQSPKLFTANEMKAKAFKTKVISDISCDINGSIPSTKRACTINDPFYDYDPVSGQLKEPFSDNRNITVTAIDNLPCELPRDASEGFGKSVMEYIIPALISPSEDDAIAEATIAEEGHLTDRFAYLKEYAYNQNHR